jgi:hypothetical protein
MAVAPPLGETGSNAAVTVGVVVQRDGVLATVSDDDGVVLLCTTLGDPCDTVKDGDTDGVAKDTVTSHDDVSDIDGDVLATVWDPVPRDRATDADAVEVPVAAGVP